MGIEFAIYDGQRVCIILREKWRVLIERPDGKRQWVEPHTLNPTQAYEPSDPNGQQK